MTAAERLDAIGSHAAFIFSENGTVEIKVELTCHEGSITAIRLSPTLEDVEP